MTDLRVIILGSSATIPTELRSLPAIAVKRKGEILLFDAGEGTQLQFRKKRLSLFKISNIFITHLHGDHITGIPGILMSLSLFHRVKALNIFGPIGTLKYISAIMETIIFDLTFDLNVKEISEGLVLETDEYQIRCISGKHVVPSIVYGLFEKERAGKIKKDELKRHDIKPGPALKRVKEGFDYVLNDGRTIPAQDLTGPKRPGRKIIYTGDTRPTNAILQFCEGADLLIYDGTFLDQHSEKALEGGHSTVTEAIELAKKAKVKQLIITHISTRYKNLSEISLNKNEEMKIIMAKDLMEIEVGKNQ